MILLVIKLWFATFSDYNFEDGTVVYAANVDKYE